MADLIAFRFDDHAPDAVRAAAAQAAELVKQVTKETQANIRQLIVDSLREGKSPYDTAAKVRDLIGLTAPHGQAAVKYRDQLVDSGLAVATADERMREYADELLDTRAETIARTEIMDALNTGQQTAWDQAVEKGHLSEDSVKEWIVTETETCDECLAMDGKQVAIGDDFPEGDPPLHPNCRCTMGIAARKGEEETMPEVTPEPPAPPPPPAPPENVRVSSSLSTWQLQQVEHLKTVARDMGFPLSDVEVLTYERKFMVGSQEFTEGGHYEPWSKKIVINSSLLDSHTSNQLRGIMAHEITHDQWQTVYEVGKEAFGVASSELTELQRAYRSFAQEINEEIETLVKTDGVTDYSRAYWKKFNDLVEKYEDGYVVDRAFETAVNETFAELANLQHTRVVNNPHKTWANLWGQLKKLYEETP